MRGRLSEKGLSFNITDERSGNRLAVELVLVWLNGSAEAAEAFNNSLAAIRFVLARSRAQ